ncbi:hypothetical protein EON82_06520 [bacterium]|nr:MAG: hypothetical protein EON82_06520 [bacterium]
MRGPDDVEPVLPFEVYSADGTQRARWICPRCRLPNSTYLVTDANTPAICRICFGAANVVTPAPPAVTVKSKWVTTLPGGASITVMGIPDGGYGYEAELERRIFGAYDTAWSRNDAYEAGVRAVQSRRKRRSS